MSDDVMETGGKVIDLMAALKAALDRTCKVCNGTGTIPVGLTGLRVCKTCGGRGESPAVVSGRSNE